MWKGPYVALDLIAQVRKALAMANPAPIKTMSRASVILPDFLGLEFLVHNGKDYKSVKVLETMIGKKLGEFSITKVKAIYKPGLKQAKRK